MILLNHLAQALPYLGGAAVVFAIALDTIQEEAGS